MRVVATAKGFHGGHLKEEGSTFIINDKPARKLRADDDELTKASAVKGMIPEAFASSWMKPYVEGAKEEEAPKDEKDPKVNLNEPKL